MEPEFQATEDYLVIRFKGEGIGNQEAPGLCCRQ